MPGLTDADLLMVADVVSELARLRGTPFDKAATGFSFATALIDPAFKTRLTKAHGRLEAHRSTKSPAPQARIAALFCDLEAAAEAVVSRLQECH